MIEFFGILTALTIIFLIWLYYPNFIAWMDHPNAKVMIPLKPSAMIPELINPNDFNKIGEKFATYGDCYGSLNTLFSGFAFSILIISLFMQRQELAAQRKELEAQRHEIQENNAIAEAQRKITEQQAQLIEQQLLDSKIQAFYQLFFKYLDEKKNKLYNLVIRTSNPIRAHTCFEQYRALLTSACGAYYNTLISNDEQAVSNLSTLAKEFNNTEEKYRHPFTRSNSFDFFTFIIQFIEAHVNLVNVDEQINILTSYTTQDEKISLLWYSLTKPEIKKIILKYEIHNKISYTSYPDIKRCFYDAYVYIPPKT